jgi:hypothetical protein
MPSAAASEAPIRLSIRRPAASMLGAPLGAAGGLHWRTLTLLMRCREYAGCPAGDGNDTAVVSILL